MAPRKRKAPNKDVIDPIKRVSKLEVEKQICKKKLDKLEREESQTKEDRFNPAERRILLDAYNVHGFQIFQDTRLLHDYFPNRKESDLKGLIQRLRSSLCPSGGVADTSHLKPLDEWDKLCQQFMGNFAKDKKVNLDDVLADALRDLADEKEGQVGELPVEGDSESSDIKPNYPMLLRNFAQLLMGNFPDRLSPLDAQISIKLFDHIDRVVDSFDLKTALAPLEAGTWLESSIQHRRKRQEMALEGLDEIDGKTKKAPTLRDIEKNRNMEALCLELPKIKRITDVLNPLCINESLLSSLME